MIGYGLISFYASKGQMYIVNPALFGPGIIRHRLRTDSCVSAELSREFLERSLGIGALVFFGFDQISLHK
jgi:hypothetical protein